MVDPLPNWSPELFSDWRSDEEENEIWDKCEIELLLNDLIREVFIQSLEYFHPIPEPLPCIEDICMECTMSRDFIKNRVNNIYENPPDTLHLMNYGEGHICASCCLDGNKCNECGISQKLIKIKCDRNVKFYNYIRSYPTTDNRMICTTEIYCPDCIETMEELPPCQYCGGVHEPWNCPSGDWDIYGNEYEIDTEGDQSLVEELEEGVCDFKDLKEDIKELMDISFELSENIPNGPYVSMMNKMKAIYNRI
ncbi:MAG: hypothetical protein CL779_02750 [Chloroflexi bacterium]|nr:hypothetical protein [Chloroflexota bacterium]|tara:strand:- start:681 stop:1433 length:753 start_codon:yes stop_codon:yes gene_type:complete